MSHRRLSGIVRLVAVVLVAALGVGIALQAGSQEAIPPVRNMAPPSLNGGTVVLHFTAIADEQLLDVELHCTSPSMAMSAHGRRAGGQSYSWSMEGHVDVLSGGQIRLDLQRMRLAFETEASSGEVAFQAGAVMASGEIKTLFKSSDVTLRVKAVFEPGER